MKQETCPLVITLIDQISYIIALEMLLKCKNASFLWRMFAAKYI